MCALYVAVRVGRGASDDRAGRHVEAWPKPPSSRYTRTGLLAQSWQIFEKADQGGRIFVVAGSPIPYGYYQEYGWRTSRRVIAGRYNYTRAIHIERQNVSILLLTAVNAHIRATIPGGVSA